MLQQVTNHIDQNIGINAFLMDRNQERKKIEKHIRAKRTRTTKENELAVDISRSFKILVNSNFTKKEEDCYDFNPHVRNRSHKINIF